MTGAEQLFNLHLWHAIDVVFLGFVGGVLGGFMGTGGAFIMTPGMMNLGVPGVIAVGSNLTHKLGRSIMGAKRHAELGHVDKKLGLFMAVTALIGVQLAVELNKYLFNLSKAPGASKSAGSAGDLYVSVLFVVVLSVISISMFIDVIRTRHPNLTRERKLGLAERVMNFRVPPMIYFPTADVTLSIWLVAPVGLLTGYLAGSIGIGGFFGVPAMIYFFGVPTVVAAGTEVFLAMFMGAFGALSYAWGGFVDLRLTFLLYLGSLAGTYLGAYGTKVVKERTIRLVTAMTIMVSVLSRLFNIPVYLGRMEVLSVSDSGGYLLGIISKTTLFVGGSACVVFILVHVLRAYRRRRQVRRLLRHVP